MNLIQDTQTTSKIDQQTMDAAQVDGLVVKLKALADPVRLQILTHILGQPQGEECTCKLAPLVGLSEPTVSHHLKKLEAAGILTKERRGMSVYYRVDSDVLHSITEVLRVTCC